MKYLLSLGLVFLLSNPFNANAQDALYSNADFKKILESYNEIIVVTNGFDYKYTGNWTSTMEITGNHAFVKSDIAHIVSCRKDTSSDRTAITLTLSAIS